MNLRIFFTSVLAVLALFAQAQKLELGLWGGTSFYSGDYSPQEFGLYFESLEPAGGIFLRMNPVKPISAELGLGFGRISENGEDNNMIIRDLRFRSPITELSLKLDVHLFRLGSPKATQVAPYLMGGGAFFRFNPQGQVDGNWIDLQPLGTEAQGGVGYDEPYSLSQFAVLAGGGIKFIFKERFTIGLELGGRKTFTDYLDDVTNAQVNYLDVLQTNGSLAAQLSNPTITDTDVENLNYSRGGEYKDWYFMSGLSFSFAFGGGDGVRNRGIGCPTF
ncbi:MAG: DUF6089 family protein [Saprospiraceae bacterium]